MGLSEEMEDSFTYSEFPEELPVLVMVSQKRDNQIPQWSVEQASQNTGEGEDFAHPSAPPAPKSPETAPDGTIARYTVLTPVDRNACKKEDLSRGTSKEVYRSEVFVLWWI
jgi:hypothetical protein